MTTASNEDDHADAGSVTADSADDRSAAAHLARNLAGLRHARGLTQDALARGPTAPAPTIPTLESGAGNPSLAILVKVAQAPGVPIDALPASPGGKGRRWPAADVAFRVKG